MTPAELDDWMVDYVERKGVVMGWDWEADLAFAKVTEVNPDTIKMMKSAVEGQGPVTYIAYKSPLWQAVKRARLRLMKRLTDLGRLSTHWAGMPTSVTGGATRTRAWEKRV